MVTELKATFKERIAKNYSPVGEENYSNWVRSVNTTIGILGERHWKASSIYRVPSKLRAVKEEAYTPQLVCIGPFHRHKPELRAMEELKWKYMSDFLKRVTENLAKKKGVTEKTQSTDLDDDESSTTTSPAANALNKCCEIISDLAEEARAWYAEDINLDKHQLMEMLLVDGCFILELIIKYCLSYRIELNVVLQTLKHDLLLLENQIPYVVLDELFNTVSSPGTSLEKYVFDFFKSVPIFEYNEYNAVGSVIIKSRGHNHLLDILRNGIIPLTYIGNIRLLIPRYHSNKISQHIKLEFKRCATELFKSGIRFQVSQNRSIVKITFDEDKGVIKIPQVSISKSNDTVIRNLVASEQISSTEGRVTAYVSVMSTLIRSPKDAKLLEREGIIIKSDGIEDVFGFFKSLSREVVVKGVDFAFSELLDNISEYQSSPLQWGKIYFRILLDEWKESLGDLRRDYFKNRWSFIAFLTASFVVILTFLQTFYTIRAYYPPYH